jgi:hypothetical protein
MKKNYFFFLKLKNLVDLAGSERLNEEGSEET